MEFDQGLGRLARVARAQGGVFSVRQARLAGFSRQQIDYRRRSGQWRPVFGRVLCHVSAQPGDAAALWAALLCIGDVHRAAVSHGCAARLWGMPVVDGPIEITVAGARTPRVSGAVVRRCPLPSADVREYEGVPVTSRARTIFDCLLTLPGDQARTLLDRSLQRGWTSPAELRDRLAGARGRIGVAQARRLVEQSEPGVYSDGERRLVRALRRRRVEGWVANFRTVVGGRRVVLDVAFPLHRVAVEVDGWAWHTDPERFQRDRSRQNALHLTGWTVLRFTWHDVADHPDHVVDVIVSALAARSGRD
ncbi:MAG: DUF559 domain-containing protein [Pseudonocardia sp.]